VPQARATTRSRDWLGLGGWLLLSLAADAVGGLASMKAGEFYEQLAKPVWAPEGWVFGPVWTVLYVMMGVAAWLVWRERGAVDKHLVNQRQRGLILFVVQLAVNALWTWLFFGWRMGGLAFAEIALLWVLIVIMMGMFARVRRVAAWLLMPYLAWVTFAMALTWSTWRHNPSLL
jgi:translocator protein